MYRIFSAITSIYKCIVLRWYKSRICNEINKILHDSNIKEGDDIIFHTDKNELMLSIYKGGTLAAGESYMAGQWDSNNLYYLLKKIIRNKQHRQFRSGPLTMLLPPNQTTSLQMIDTHYNLSNEFFSSWLDTNMQYSCAYFARENMTLDEAQIAKMNLIGRKLKLKKGMTVLDIGCGWGMLAQYLYKTFGVLVTAINLSSEHLKYANSMCDKNNCNVNYIYGDFSEISKHGLKFDRIISVGFYEHVGEDRYDEFYKVMQTNLKDDGIALLHTIGRTHDKKSADPWILKYIFTRGVIPNLCSITSHSENNGFIIEDVHNFGMDYGTTLLHWLDRFEKSDSDLKKDPTFYRMWKYYLSSCAASFHEKDLFLWQIIFTKKENTIKYTGER